MTQAKLRSVVFAAWMGFWVLSTILVCTAPLVVKRGPVPIIAASQVGAALMTVSTIWIPPLTCFSSFWFPAQARQKSKSVKVSRARVFAALSITSIYLLTVVLLIIFPLYFIRYSTSAAVLAEGTSFLEQLDFHVKVALIASPLALAPISWLTQE